MNRDNEWLKDLDLDLADLHFGYRLGQITEEEAKRAGVVNEQGDLLDITLCTRRNKVAKKPTSDAVRKLDTRARGKFKENVQEFVNRFGTNVPPGDYNCRLSNATLYLNKNDDPQVDFVFVVTEGSQEGQQIRDMHTMADKGNRTVDMMLQIVAGKMQAMGYETKDVGNSAALLEGLEALTAESPEVALEVEDGQYRNIRNLRLLTAADNGAAQAKKPAKKPDTKKKEMSPQDLGVKADADDEFAQTQLVEMAEEKGLDPDDFETWVELAQAIEGGETEENEGGWEQGQKVTVNDPNDSDCPWDGEIVSVLNDMEVEVSQDGTDDTWTVQTKFLS